ncbi:cbb3-type cytochrome c oxidase subunit 3 [Taibaiella helva]|uniref:cbb3-type cytochrome c oxidase subunit 3 n=1 Tax=Taibaiella helva TaxID=2301235 RepID=UPI000E59899C|nr:cbb3-type cytochrome c oxidase subunit 3 [Taibaiella helva]
MKFTNYLKDIHNVSIYPVFSLILFAAVFAGVVLYTFGTNRKKMQEHANIPIK